MLLLFYIFNYWNLLFIIIISFSLYITYYTVTIIRHTENIIYLNFKLENFLFKNSIFLKESSYIDFLQKKIIDSFFKNSLIISTQFFNLNFFSVLTFKYINSILLNNIYLLVNYDKNNITQIIFEIFSYLSTVLTVSILVIVII
jgi:hypothetical protein